MFTITVRGRVAEADSCAAGHTGPLVSNCGKEAGNKRVEEKEEKNAATQEASEAEPGRDTRAPGQRRHVESLVAPIAVEYFPGGHSAHLAAPAAEYVPGAQGVQSLKATAWV
jgi:hypothetical protein